MYKTVFQNMSIGQRPHGHSVEHCWSTLKRTIYSLAVRGAHITYSELNVLLFISFSLFNSLSLFLQLIRSLPSLTSSQVDRSMMWILSNAPRPCTIRVPHQLHVQCDVTRFWMCVVIQSIDYAFNATFSLIPLLLIPGHVSDANINNTNTTNRYPKRKHRTHVSSFWAAVWSRTRALLNAWAARITHTHFIVCLAISLLPSSLPFVTRSRRIHSILIQMLSERTLVNTQNLMIFFRLALPSNSINSLVLRSDIVFDTQILMKATISVAFLLSSVLEAKQTMFKESRRFLIFD